MSGLVGDAEDQFSCVTAHIMSTSLHVNKYENENKCILFQKFNKIPLLKLLFNVKELPKNVFCKIQIFNFDKNMNSKYPASSAELSDSAARLGYGFYTPPKDKELTNLHMKSYI